MNYLLDSHVFIWVGSQPQYLSPQAYKICHDPNNTLWVSIASLWELQIKISLGKLSLPNSLLGYWTVQQQNLGCLLLPIQINHLATLLVLPHHHRDPFDRMLIAQAQTEGFTLLSRDTDMAKYQVNIAW
jgi:PIN domain nuclease of toxin-antitoxin system